MRCIAEPVGDRLESPAAGESHVTKSLTEARLDEPLIQHMHQNFPPLLASHTVGETLDSLRQHPPGGRIIYFYVVDSEGRLVGVVPTRLLVLSGREVRLTDIMIRK